MSGGAPGTAFTVRDCDDYLDHLVAASAQHEGVIATEEIRGTAGALLLRAGARLGPQALERMRGQRLARPLDELLEYRPGLDAEGLVSCFVELIEAESDLARVEAHYGSLERVRHLCHRTDWPPALLQKLAVMQHVLPRVFHRALFCAWLAALIAVERRLEAGELALLFQAGLWHDLGLLHIPASLVDKKSDISAAEWASIQSHVEISARIVEQSAGSPPPRLLRLLREHHERHDGAGYPAARAGGDLDPLSPVIALTDMLHAQRFHSMLLRGHLVDCMPYLRVNRRTFGLENYGPAARVLLAARDPDARRERPATAVSDLLEVNHSLVTLLGDFAAARELLAAMPQDRLVHSLRSLIEQVQWVTLASGLGNPQLEQWLEESLAPGRDDGATDMQATAREVFWLVRRFDRQLRELLAAEPATPAPLAPLSARMGAELERAWLRFHPASAPR